MIFCMYKNLPPFPILSLMNPVKSPPPLICKINFDTILPSVPNSSKYPLSPALKKYPVSIIEQA